MSDLIIDLALGNPISEQMIKDELFEICDREHSSCNPDCPVYFLNGNKILDKYNNGYCDCHKQEIKMLEFIRSTKNKS